MADHLASMLPDAHNRPPTILIIFGATGDLVARKIGPALLHMKQHDAWPERFRILGLSRSVGDDLALRAHLKKNIDTHGSSLPEADDSFFQVFQSVPGSFDDPKLYESLVNRVHDVEMEWGMCSNKLIYLAVPPASYPDIFKHLAKVRLNEPCSTTTGWTRIIVEKPYGSTLSEAEKNEELLEEYFKPEQVYRIDHYLGKQAVQNILSFRFANSFLEPAWDGQHIERIEVRLHEKMTVKGRGAFYDRVGALLDVGQNHLLELLAMVTMDHPLNLTPETIWQKRQDILESLEPIHDIGRQTFRAQYDGYRQEENVNPASVTETFFRLNTVLNHPHWNGVPVVLEAGKGMPEDDKRVILHFRHPEPCLCPPNGPHARSRIEFRLHPHPGIAVQFFSRQPGKDGTLQERWMNFDYPADEEVRYVAEYSQLLTDAVAGNQFLFVSGREAMAGWKFVAPVMDAWHDATSIPTYPIGTLPSADLSVGTTDRPKTIGMVGLGKMGLNLSLRLREKDWHVVGYNRSPMSISEITMADSLAKLVDQLPEKKIVWVMVPNAAVDDVMFGPTGLSTLLKRGDVIIDGGNSNYKDSIRRATEFSKHGITYIDVGVSGGPGGARSGPALMVGGKREEVKSIETLFYDLARHNGYRFFPGHGAGHFVKMIHNGIEYGMMQSLAEGFGVLEKSPFDYDLTAISEVYNNGSVIESRLVEWLRRAFVLHGEQLDDVTSIVAHTGEGEWTVQAAKEYGVDTPAIRDSLHFRKTSGDHPSYIGKILSALREQFGGHAAEASKK